MSGDDTSRVFNSRFFKSSFFKFTADPFTADPFSSVGVSSVGAGMIFHRRGCISASIASKSREIGRAHV